MRSRRWLTWLIFGICALAVVEGLGWVTWKAIRLERAEEGARAQAAFQEQVRLALWRMESEVTPILAQEAARPYFHYQSFYAAERAYTQMLQEFRPGDVRVPSPLLDSGNQFVRVYYQIGPGGEITSPQAPTGNLRDLAESQYVDGEFIVLADERLTELAKILGVPRAAEGSRAGGLERNDALPPQNPELLVEPFRPPQAPPPPAPAQIMDSQSAQQLQQSFQSSEKEYVARQNAAQTANVAPNRQQRGNADLSKAPPEDKRAAGAAGPGAVDRERRSARSETDRTPAAPSVAPTSPPKSQDGLTEANKKTDLESEKTSLYKNVEKPLVFLESEKPADEIDRETRTAPAPPQVETGPLDPFWCANPRSGAFELILRRTVTVGAARLEQGIWIDWPTLRARLLASAHDLVPHAVLQPIAVPVSGAPAPPTSQMLASIPVLLDPGPAPAPVHEPLFSSAHFALLVTWGAVLAGVLAIGLVLRTSMELGDRRGRFVSAVTHELRTPLTTFRLYTGMLAGGMVGESSRREYLSTLESESGRLARIVENVLDYARLGGRAARRNVLVGASDLVASIIPSLDRAVSQRGMLLIADIDIPPSLRVSADAATVERILLNLVDNACKYAGASADRRIHVTARALVRPLRPLVLEVRVRDHGPGIPRAERRQVFRPFHRARRDAEGPQSGLGLGLALSRGLARELGGELELAWDQPGGAELRLLVPAEYHTKS
jgi:signal transduction histidine kinase